MRFYRTKVELKCRFEHFHRPAPVVFIVPKWNWNCGRQTGCVPVLLCFYRTKVELKWAFSFELVASRHRFYRTKVELKLGLHGIGKIVPAVFLSYQSGIEMLFIFQHLIKVSAVFIVPKWNWNVKGVIPKLFAKKFLSYQSGIEIQQPKTWAFCRWVFIVPKWNWNLKASLKPVEKPHVFIVPKWNWNPVFVYFIFGSNQAFLSYQSGIEILMN